MFVVNVINGTHTHSQRIKSEKRLNKHINAFCCYIHNRGCHVSCCVNILQQIRGNARSLSESLGDNGDSRNAVSNCAKLFRKMSDLFVLKDFLIKS